MCMYKKYAGLKKYLISSYILKCKYYNIELIFRFHCTSEIEKKIE